ncbi:hypothetical protein QRX60_13110 [Amycolatopsis mongoliensis]|uniref:Uncharacterized protein n=1 Tax=Amycolatopsis mongoliensis TaxID=715475 RepID=A0A9Y2JU56_9PSEU|nr:hypothetical protein [Amycolatopsis sp. 4-36]WIY04730.1 hypothetical protein QRX60_13110 [Amycolatopsis sp. 4-36]
MESTSYTVALEPGRRWLELVAWGPSGIEDGPSVFANAGSVHFITEADAAPVEYAPRGLRPFPAPMCPCGAVRGGASTALLRTLTCACPSWTS